MADSTITELSGKVLLSGTQAGIADLLVVLYDIDPTTTGQDGATSVSLDDPVESVLRDPSSQFWLSFPGDRIGSVLTDRDGTFSLSFDDQAFRLRNSEKRPDVWIALMAPDNPGTAIIGLHPARRLLYIGRAPRVNAGRRESYIITLEPDLLRRHAIALPGSVRGNGNGPERINSVQASGQDTRAAEQAIIRAGVAAAQPRLRALNTFKKQAWRALRKDLPATGETYYLAPDATQAQRAGKFAAAVIDGIGRLGSRTRPMPGARLWLTEEDIDHLTPAERDRLADGDSVAVDMCDLLARKGMAHEMVRVNALLGDAKARQLRRRHAPDPATPGAIDERPAPPPRADDLMDEIRNKVLGQIDELPGFDEAGRGALAGELLHIKRTVDKLELAGGPANVTAFHDVHTLQVAFKDVWTEAFDATLGAQVAALYEQSARLHDDYGLEVPDLAAVGNINELRAYLAELRGSTEYAEILEVDPDVKEVYPQMTRALWNRLDADGRAVLLTTAGTFKRPWDYDDIDPPLSLWQSQAYLQEKWEQVIRFHQTTTLARVEALILDISDMLGQPHAFHYFAPYSVNYGMLLTYRQELTPESYQVGKLVSTIPLAPGEKRSFKVTVSEKKSQSRKQVEKAQMERSSEANDTRRAEVEVLNRAASSSNFRMAAEGTVTLGVGSISSTTEFAANQSQESSKNQKGFNEAVRRASEKVRQEREVTVEEAASSELSGEQVREITNPNNELTVTYLLYELERRYRLSTRLHKLTSTLMVAMDIPASHEITDAWILAHAWILRRVLLDDSFLDAIGFIEEGMAAAGVNIELLKANYKVQKDLVVRLEGQLLEGKSLRDRRRESLLQLTREESIANASESDTDDVARAIFSGGLSLLFDQDNSPDRSEILKAQRQGVEQALKYIDETVEELAGKLKSAQAELTRASEAYGAAIGEQAHKDVLVSQCKLHLRAHILHYMHAIWAHMHPQQLELELYHRQVPFISGSATGATLRRARADEAGTEVPGVLRDGVLYIVECSAPAAPDPAAIPTRAIGEIADLSTPLGFWGNYIIFPLKQCSHITQFMSQSFVDSYMGLRDPGTNDSMTAEELLAYGAEIWNDPEAALSEAERAALVARITRTLSATMASQETIVLPSGQLYMDALKGEQSLLEDFKLAHRGMDMLAVQEQVRAQRLDNLRQAARLVGATPLLDDPQVDKQIAISGATGVVVDTD